MSEGSGGPAVTSGAKLTLYHGSYKVIEAPEILKGYRSLDFGPGFCTTMDREKAVSFAKKVKFRDRRDKGFVGLYETIPLESMRQRLSVLEFEDPSLDWLIFIYGNRNNPPLSASHDVVYGPVAVGDTTEKISNYNDGFIKDEYALQWHTRNKFYHQFVFQTEKALSWLKFLKAFEV
jgi:hypothetical protein